MYNYSFAKETDVHKFSRFGLVFMFTFKSATVDTLFFAFL